MNTQSSIIQEIEKIKAKNITTIDILDEEYLADQMIICTGSSSTHVKAIAKNIILNFKKTENKIIGIEGMETGEWVLIDFSDIILHIMQQKTREYYNLEKLWSK